MSPPVAAAAPSMQTLAPAASASTTGNAYSLAGVPALDAAVLSSIVRTHGKMARGGQRIRIVNATPDVARMLQDLGLGWMLEGRPLPDLAPANEPMRGNAS